MYYGIVKLLLITYHWNGQAVCRLCIIVWNGQALVLLWNSQAPAHYVSWNGQALILLWNSQAPAHYVSWNGQALVLVWNSQAPAHYVCIIKWSSRLPILSYGIVELLYYYYGIVKLLPITYHGMIKPFADYILWNGQALAHYVGIIKA